MTDERIRPNNTVLSTEAPYFYKGETTRVNVFHTVSRIPTPTRQKVLSTKRGKKGREGRRGRGETREWVGEEETNE